MKMLPYSHFQPLSLREVRPTGWLQDFLLRQATGLTGNVAVSRYPYGYKFWGSHEDDTGGSYDPWWPYEQTGYWIDGALKCGYLCGDMDLYQQALDEVDFAIDHADADGFIGPDRLREKDRWPHAVFFRAVLAQYEISGDRRYLEALMRHYRALPHPMGWNRDVTGVEALLTLYQQTEQPDLLDLAQDLYARFNQQWPDRDPALPTLLSDKRPTEHGVTFNEEAKLAAMLYCATGNTELLRAVVKGYEKLDQYALLADGLHSCSERIRGQTARDTHETCDISDHTWALGYLLQASGQARYADRIEQVIFNALPGAITKDFHALQYFSCPNQVVATSTSNHSLLMRGLNWMSYRPDHEVQCCPGNLHRAMPNYIARMWMSTPGDGIAAVLYGPGKCQTTAGAHPTNVSITADTRYPFQESVIFTIRPVRPTVFPFVVRIPTWCNQAAILVNGQSLPADLQPGSFYPIEREWRDGDQVTLSLPFTLALHHWPDGGISLSYGPLTLSLSVPARAEVEADNSTVRQRQAALGDHYVPRPAVVKPEFPAWNLYPAGRWNYALCVDETSLKDLQVEWNQDCPDPLDPANPVLKLRLPARRVRNWHVVHTHRLRRSGHWMEGDQFIHAIRTMQGDFWLTPPLPDPQQLPARLSEQVETIELIPYAATLLRLTVFPQG